MPLIRANKHRSIVFFLLHLARICCVYLKLNTHMNIKAELSVRGECDVNVNLFLGG